MPDIVRSVNGVRVRLTDERWAHIVRRHRQLASMRSEMLDTVATPFAVLAGSDGEVLAVRRVGRWWIVVAYVEVTESDGFIVTAFLSRLNPTTDRTVIWP